MSKGSNGSGWRRDATVPAPPLQAITGPGGQEELLRAEYPHCLWAIDFLFDQTIDGRTGRTIKCLNVIDEYSQLCLAIRVDRRCRAAEVNDTIEVLHLKFSPTHLQMNSGPEFIANALHV